MKFCRVPEATHFYIINYDHRVGIVPKLNKNLLIS